MNFVNSETHFCSLADNSKISLGQGCIQRYVFVLVHNFFNGLYMQQQIPTNVPCMLQDYQTILNLKI